MKFSKSKFILFAVAIILIITNPSYSKFNNFIKEIPIVGTYTTAKKTFNGFIFSIYSKEIVYTYTEGFSYNKKDEIIGSITTVKYLGVLSNFFKISEEAKKVNGRLQLQ